VHCFDAVVHKIIPNWLKRALNCGTYIFTVQDSVMCLISAAYTSIGLCVERNRITKWKTYLADFGTAENCTELLL